MKKYKIKTVQDMINCTNEKNIDDFLADLKTLITLVHSFQNINNLVAEMKNIPKNEAIIAFQKDGFIWTDDGKHNVKITLTKKDVIGI